VDGYSGCVAQRSYSQWIGIVCCISVLLLFGFVLLLSPYYWHKTDNMHTHLTEFLEESLHMSSTMLHSSSLHLISLISLLHNNQVRILPLCHLQAYQGGESDRASPRLTPLDILSSTASVPAYLLSLDFMLRFNVQSKFADRWDNKRSVEIAYNVTSNYNRFTQIKLVAREFDVYRKTAKVVRELVLCSDDALATETERCSQFVGRDQLFVMNRVKHAPLYEVLMEEAERVRHNTLGVVQDFPAEPEEQISQAYNVDNNAQRQQQASDGEKPTITAHEMAQREEITGVRFYSVEFYTSRVTEDNRLLTVKLDKCLAN
jgi:hypothetical protein